MKHSQGRSIILPPSSRLEVNVPVSVSVQSEVNGAKRFVPSAHWKIKIYSKIKDKKEYITKLKKGTGAGLFVSDRESSKEQAQRNN